MRRLHRLMASVLVAAFALAAGLPCATGEETAAPMPCCERGHDDCVMAATADACCPSDRAVQQQTAAKMPQVDQPAAPLSRLAYEFPPAPHVQLAAAREYGRATLTGSSPPRYVLLGSFLI